MNSVCRAPLVWLFLSGTLVLLVNSSMLADEPPAPSDVEKQNIENALQVTGASAAKYEFKLGNSDEVSKLRQQPILRWSNPERGQVYGNVFLWTHRGRPAVVGSLFKWFSPFTHMSHEFHSLASTEIVAQYDQADVWKTSSPGATFAIVPEAAEVSSSPSGRLAQMRQIARQFTVRRTERDGQKNEMRLLAQPVYRYELEKDDTELLDGALFVFVQGTDPEMWLMLEAQRGSEQAQERWRYAVARMNSVAFNIEHNGRQVAHFDILPWSEITGHKAIYTSFQFNRP